MCKEIIAKMLEGGKGLILFWKSKVPWPNTPAKEWVGKHEGSLLNTICCTVMLPESTAIQLKLISILKCIYVSNVEEELTVLGFNGVS